MTAKTRYFLFGSVLVLIVGLSIGLVAYYGGVPKGLFDGQPGPAEMKYLPADAAVVAYANVKDVMASQLRQRLRQFDGMTDQGRSEFKDKTGIDIEQDIDHVVASMSGKAGSENHSGLVVATGRFDQGRLEALALENGGKVETYKGKRLVTALGDKAHAGENTHAASMAIAFLGQNSRGQSMVALGGTDIVRQTIDRADGSASVLGNKDLMTMVAGMNDASLWAVGNFDALRAEAQLPAEISAKIPPITWFSASGHVNGGLQATLTAEAKDAEAAKNLRDIITGFTALAKMQTGSNPAMQKMMPDVQVGGGDSKTVSVSFAVTTDMLDAMTAAKAAAGAAKKTLPKGTEK